MRDGAERGGRKVAPAHKQKIYLYIFVCMYVCIDIYIYIYIYVCVCVCEYIYSHLRKWIVYPVQKTSGNWV